MPNKKRTLTRPAATSVTALLFVFAAGASSAQQTQPANTPPPGASDTDEEVITLTPFEVSAENDKGYNAATTLAGNRLNSELRDLGNAVSVVTAQFLRDVGATSNETLLQYTVGGEVGNIYGNFAGTGDGSFLDESSNFARPNQNTRVRGLTSADNTRDYYLTDIPWDAYNVDRVDMQRGPNSILFGQGSPAGIINSGLKQAGFKNSNEIQNRFGSYGSNRTSVDINRVLVKDQVSIRIAGLYDDTKYKQDPAFQLSKRIYGATRIEPAFLKKGSARTVFKANFEAGDISSNRPRSLPPIDLISPWFQSGTYAGGYQYDDTSKQWKSTRTYNYLNRETFNPYQLQDDNTGRPNHGQVRPSINGGPDAGKSNPAFNPWIGNMAQQFGGPLAFIDGLPGGPAYYVAESRVTRGIGTDGAVDGTIGGIPFNRPGGINTMANWARLSGQPFGNFGVYKDRQLTDPSIFDFYNNLIDGPNKHEWQRFTAYNLNLAQTFFNDQMGIQLDYSKEKSAWGQLSLLTGERQALYIDINNVYANGTNAGANGEPFANGTPNPNVGRPFVSDNGQFGNNETHSTRESKRATLFATHDFTRDAKNVWTKILGQHTVTGLFSKDGQETDARSWARYGILDPAYRTFLGLAPNTKFTDNALAVNAVMYLGPSLSGRSSAAGANIPRVTTRFNPQSGQVMAFDSTWAGNGVNPAADWVNEYYPDIAPFNTYAPVGDSTRGARWSTQAENPANYVGWTAVPLNITDSEKGNRDALTTSARLTKAETSSKAFVWQGHFWDNFLVGTWGVRKDIAKSWGLSRDVNGSPGFGQLDLGQSYTLPENFSNRLEVTSHSWMAVAHLTQLIGDRSPIRVSVFYNKSTNFQPLAQRVDLYGTPIAAPAGKTIDKGILFETKDGKYSLKLNRYVTSVTNASSTAIGGAWFIGSSQAWAGNWANIFEYDLGGDTIDTQNQGDPGRHNYGTAPGETQADADRREQAAIAAWRTWQKSVDPRFYAAWGINLNDLTKSIGASTPQGFAVTEDSTSKGYEAELSANPIKNLRLMVNVAKTEAVRTNIGGAALANFISAYEKALKTTAAGDLRIWWGGAGNETTLSQWNNNIGAEWAQRHLQEGTNVPELRKWRVNAIANYDFDRGIAKGFNVGAGLRWEDKIIIGYKPVVGATADDISFDLNSPYMGPAETSFDFWIGYSRKIWRNIDWNIQLNVRNAFVGNELIPITVQPDGSPAGYRIKPPQIWSLTNTFKF
jgi:TonB-dependent Receptor Plug Domain